MGHKVTRQGQIEPLQIEWDRPERRRHGHGINGSDLGSHPNCVYIPLFLFFSVF